MLKHVFFVIFGLLSLVWSESIGDKNKYYVTDLTPIVEKDCEYSKDYSSVINNNVSYLYLYDYIPVCIL